MNLFFLVLISYLIGSIPFSCLIAKLKGVSLSECGTQNLGASNVVLTSGFALGVIALLLDILKGFLPVVFSRILIGEDYSAVLAALASILGHDFSIYLGFRGGKGFATTGGAFMAVHPYVIPVCIIFYWAIYFFVRAFIPTTLILFVFFPFIIWQLGLGQPYIILAVLSSLLIFYTHRGDIFQKKEKA